MKHTRLRLFSTEKLQDKYLPIIGDVLSQLETNVELAQHRCYAKVCACVSLLMRVKRGL